MAGNYSIIFHSVLGISYAIVKTGTDRVSVTRTGNLSEVSTVVLPFSVSILYIQFSDAIQMFQTNIHSRLEIFLNFVVPIG